MSIEQPEVQSDDQSLAKETSGVKGGAMGSGTFLLTRIAIDVDQHG